MRRHLAAAMTGVLVLGAAACAEAGSAADPWAAIRMPAAGGAQSLGTPAAGCIAGAVALPLDGEGYQVLRPQRNRFYAHPRTIAFVQGLGRQAAAGGYAPLLVGDLSQPRGGPMAFGHGSHQNGLDVDIWFRLPGGRWTEEQLARPEPVSMVRGTRVDPDTWTDTHYRLLKLAASSPEVDRIFVNPAIKRAMCRAAPARDDRSWLRKLRPWWGHDEHFHVRLSCPADSPDCERQKPMPEGDGCSAELDSWSSKPTWPAPPSRPHHQSRPLPEACAGVFRKG